jgi:hypothetical protein
VRFFDANQGVACGIPSAMFPSAVYRTRDGGAHWTPWPGSSSGWADGLVDARGEGLLIDRSGQLVRAEPGALTPLGKLKQESRLPLRLSDNGQGLWFLCGNQGLVRLSIDRGRSWRLPGDLPSGGVLSEFDWQAVEAIGSDAWIVGVPGSRVLTTHDGGRSWQLQETGHTLPLYALEFVDAQHGWAAGALGTVLVTSDGGRSWSHQRGERHRLAAMGVFGQTEQVSWELVAQLAAGEGYWTRVEVLADGAPPPAASSQTPIATRLHEATVGLGGAGANLIQSLPAPDARWKMPAGLLRRQWDHVAGSDSAHQLTEYLVRQIRTWRPDLVVVAEPAHADDGLNQLTRQLVLQATEEAADAGQFGTQQQAGLTPWRVARVTTLSTDASENGYTVHGHQLVLSLGQSLTHLADGARAKLVTEYRRGPGQLTLRTLAGDNPARRGLFASADDSASITRRSQDSLADDVRQRSQQVQRLRNLVVLLRGATPDDDTIWQQALHLAAELPADDRAELFWVMASENLNSGNAAMAFQLLNLLHRETSSRPQPLREAARVRLFWYLASAEAGLQWPLPPHAQFSQVAQANGLVAEPGEVRTVNLLALLPNEAGGRNALPRDARAAPIASDPNAGRSRQEMAERLMAMIQAEQPDLYFEPMLRFPLAAQQRRQGQAELAGKFWQSQLVGRTDPAWRTWAASELALLEGDRLLARPVWSCPRLSQPPRLDGLLDDTVWQSAPEVSLQSNATGALSRSATRVRLGYDAEFLYLAVSADKVPALSYVARDRTRRRDELADGDRIEIYLDVDRDAVTHWALAIDYQGGASDRLNDDPSWNPQWFVAGKDDDSGWSAEAAIPLNSLSQPPATSGTSWCLGVQRIMPGYDWETWFQPAPVESRPAEFGLLRFE